MDDEDIKEINYREAMAEILKCNDLRDVNHYDPFKIIEKIIIKHSTWNNGDWVWCRECREPVQFGKHQSPKCLITDIESLMSHSDEIQEMDGFWVGDKAYFNENEIIILSFDFRYHEVRVWGKWVDKRRKGVPYPLLINLRHEPLKPSEIIKEKK